MDQPAARTRDFWAVGFAIVLPTLVTLAYFVLAARAPATVQQLTYAVAKVVQFLFPIAWVLAVQARRPKLWNWNSQGVVFGVVFGLCIAVAMVCLYHFILRSAPFFEAAVGHIQAKIQGMNLANPITFTALGVFYSLVHSLLEEYYWRWFIFGQLSELTRLVPAIVISSLGFMAHHVLVIGTYFGFLSPITWVFSLSVAIGGAVWAGLYHRTGSLLGPWLSHLLVDAAIFTVGYQVAAPLLGK